MLRSGFGSLATTLVRVCVTQRTAGLGHSAASAQWHDERACDEGPLPGDRFPAGVPRRADGEHHNERMCAKPTRAHF